MGAMSKEDHDVQRNPARSEGRRIDLDPSATINDAGPRDTRRHGIHRNCRRSGQATPHDEPGGRPENREVVGVDRPARRPGGSHQGGLAPSSGAERQKSLSLGRDQGRMQDPSISMSQQVGDRRKKDPSESEPETAVAPHLDLDPINSGGQAGHMPEIEIAFGAPHRKVPVGLVGRTSRHPRRDRDEVDRGDRRFGAETEPAQNRTQRRSPFGTLAFHCDRNIGNVKGHSSGEGCGTSSRRISTIPPTTGDRLFDGSHDPGRRRGLDRACQQTSIG